MMLQVMYRDRSYDMVKPFFLQDLIRSRKIKGFRRSEGWVDVDAGPLRRSSLLIYSGPERRTGSDQTLW